MYIYARCEKVGSAGTITFTTDQIKVDEDPTYYYFLLGVLHAAVDGVRWISLTYGATAINGRYIRTGRIISQDGLNYFDLDQNQFRMGNTSSQLDWNVTAPDQLTLKGVLVQSGGGTTFPVSCFRGNYDAVTTYYRGDEVTNVGESWLYINPIPSSGQTPAEGSYWTKKAAAGTDGADGAPGADGNDGADGANGPSTIYRGLYAADSTYYGTANRVDVVQYSGGYYVARTDAPGGSFSGILPTNTSYWNSFGANFESIATGLLFAELAYVDNLGVRVFEGSPTTQGDLTGTVSTITPNIALSEQWWDDFNYNIGSKVSNNDVNYIAIAPSLNQEPPNGAYWELDTNQPQKRKDKITLLGNSGRASVLCDGVSRLAIYNQTRTITAADFVTNHAAAFLAAGTVLTSVAEELFLEALVAGVDFSGSTLISNVADTFLGGIKIYGNDIWENSVNGNSGSIKINIKGYNGGYTQPRWLFIGDGQGNIIMQIGPNSIVMNAAGLIMNGLPTSSSGLPAGALYRSGNDLMIAT
jgi:hypothetical protein